MSTDNQTVSMRILDKEYQVACPPDQQADLLAAASFLDQQMRKIRESGKVVGLERIAVMAALNVTYDLKKCQSSTSEQLSSGSSDQVRKLNNKLDGALQRLMQLEM